MNRCWSWLLRCFSPAFKILICNTHEKKDSNANYDYDDADNCQFAAVSISTPHGQVGTVTSTTISFATFCAVAIDVWRGSRCVVVISTTSTRATSVSSRPDVARTSIAAVRRDGVGIAGHCDKNARRSCQITTTNARITPGVIWT